MPMTRRRRCSDRFRKDKDIVGNYDMKTGSRCGEIISGRSFLPPLFIQMGAKSLINVDKCVSKRSPSLVRCGKCENLAERIALEMVCLVLNNGTRSVVYMGAPM